MGKNKRKRRLELFGSTANGDNLSYERFLMMNVIKTFTKKRYGLEMTIGMGKRYANGVLREPIVGVEKEAFDVFTIEGHIAELFRLHQIEMLNSGLAPGEKPFVRHHEKPDWQSGFLETQPNPDAAIHELAHLVLAILGMSMSDFQVWMDREWGASQRENGHLQQKRTAGEVQPMALENLLRRRLGLPPHRSFKRVADPFLPVEQCIDGTGPRFFRARNNNGEMIDYMRATNLLSTDNRKQFEETELGILSYDKDNGWTESTSIHALINLRDRNEKIRAQKLSRAKYSAITTKTLSSSPNGSE